jgi:hypothetical protein
MNDSGTSHLQENSSFRKAQFFSKNLSFGSVRPHADFANKYSLISHFFNRDALRDSFQFRSTRQHLFSHSGSSFTTASTKFNKNFVQRDVMLTSDNSIQNSSPYGNAQKFHRFFDFKSNTKKITPNN